MLQYAVYELRRHGIAHAHGGLVGRRTWKTRHYVLITAYLARVRSERTGRAVSALFLGTSKVQNMLSMDFR